MAYTPKNANGQATMANSSPVVIASDQTAVPASQSGTWNVTNVSGTVSLPTGASTAANQTTIIGHLDGVEGLLTTIDSDTGNLPTIETNTDFGTVVGGGTETGALRVTIANNSTGVVSVDDNGSSLTVDGTVTANLAAGTNNIGDVDVLSVVPGTSATSLGKAEDAAHTTGDVGVMALGVRRDTPAVSSGTTGDYEPVSMDANGATWVSLATKLDATNDAVAIGSKTSGGLTIFRSIDIDESEEEVKGSAGQVYAYYIYNNAASTRFVKFYNATAASVTVGTTTPVLTIPVPAGSAANLAIPQGIAFGTAISVAATTGVADNDTGAPSANDVVINILYT